MATNVDTYRATQANNNMMPQGNGSASPDAPREKDFESSYHLNNDMDPEHALRRIQTSGSLSISPELFEKIYLSPQNKVSGDLRKTFGNPTPIAIGGFLLSLSPLSCILMGWRGAGGGGASDVGAYFFFGGLLMILGSIGEWIIGNTFPFVVFGTFGAHWLTTAATLVPAYNAWGAFSTTDNPAEGLTTVGYNASIAYYYLFMGVLCFVFMVCSLRTNLVFFGIFTSLVPAFGCLAGAYWNLALGEAAYAGKLLVAAGACTFVTCMLGWWIFFAIMLASLDFPFQIPVGDLSHIIKGASEKAKAKEEYSA